MTMLKQFEQQKFKTWQGAVAFAEKNKLWGTVTVIKKGDFYVIVDKGQDISTND